MSERYVPGEKIRITIDAEVLGQPAADEIEYTYPTHLGAVEGLLALDSDATSVERVAPAEWPPKPGDLWRDRDGFLHFAASYSPDYDDKEDSDGIDSGGVRVVLLSQHSDESCAPGHRMHRPENVIQQSGPLALVHREDEQDPPSCTECGVDVVQVDGSWVHAAPTVGAHAIRLEQQDGGEQS